MYAHNPTTHESENSTKYHKSCRAVKEMPTPSDTDSIVLWAHVLCSMYIEPFFC